MIDTHLHVLPAIDDGSRSTAESLEILQNLIDLGFTDAICTPHYLPDSDYCPNNQRKRAVFSALQTAAQHLPINLHLGNEAYIDTDLYNLIQADEIQLIGDRFLLFELPFYAEFQGLPDLLHNLKVKGITPILAHPERYVYFQENYGLVDQFKASGLLFQSNYGSIVGQYGKSAEKLVKYLFKNGYVDFLGTDIHRANSQVFLKFPRIKRKIIRLIGVENFEQIIANAKELIN
mgnify:CR=1 FL=1